MDAAQAPDGSAGGRRRAASRRFATRILLTTGAVLGALYLAVLGLLFTAQRSLLFPGSDRQARAAEAGLAGFQDLTLETADGERLLAWWQPPRPGRAVILYFHGNGGSLWNRRRRVALLGQDGTGVLIASYRGYSGSTGTPSEDGLAEDARTAYAWLAQRYEPYRIVLYGESLGSGVAVRLAAERAVGGVILDAPYTSTADVARRTYWYVPVDLLMRDQFRSSERIGALKAPLLVLHGERDGLIPIVMGQRLYEAAPEPKRFVRLPSANHTDVLEKGGLAPMRAFLREIEAGFPS